MSISNLLPTMTLKSSFSSIPRQGVTVNPVFADVEFPSAEVDQFRNDKYFIDGSDQTRRIAAETQVGIDGGSRKFPP